MTWDQRLKPGITLTSPGGNRFEALWRDSERTISKKLGIFELPDKTGAVVQDLDVGAFRHSINIYFEGPNNDTDASRFMESCKQRGEWAIIHPTKGELLCYLVSAKEGIAPIENGNYTEIATEWIQPEFERATLTPPELSRLILSSADRLSETTASQFEYISNDDKEIELSATGIETKAVINAVNDRLSSVYNSDSETASKVLSIQSGIISDLTEDTLDFETLAGQIQALILQPVNASTNFERFRAYQSFMGDIVARGELTEPTGENRNRIAVRELALTMGLTALCRVAITSEITVRTRALALIDSITSELSDITNYLDTAQVLFKDVDIDKQYFSQS